jgi:NodT family efflux transporter outer membrane factor (OMF) lipoprotein
MSMIHDLSATARAATCGLLGVLTLSGCAGLPPSQATARLKPAGHYASGESLSAAAAEWPQESWWHTYADQQLDALIDEALAGSPSIAVAAARLERAAAAATVSGSALKPQLSASAAASEQKQSYNYLSPAAVTPQNWNDYGRASLDFGFELDFWGKNRAALAAAVSETEAARADAAQARLTLASAIASAYAELAREEAALDTARAAYELRSKTAELFRERLEHGLETLGGVRQVEARRAAAAAQLLALEEQRALQRNRIAALVGAGPDRALSITRPTVNLARPFGLPDAVGAQLLGRRPDIAAARLRAQAAARRIDVARDAFYPNVNLAAFFGVQSLGLDMLTKDGSSIGSVGPALSLPIFSGGRLRGQLSGARAEYAEAAASYEGTVIQALHEVADAAVSQKALGPQLARADEAVAAAREAWRIQNNRYEGGLATYLEVLSAEDYLLSNLQTQSDLQSRAFALDVALVRALGGGYSTPHS